MSSLTIYMQDWSKKLHSQTWHALKIKHWWISYCIFIIWVCDLAWHLTMSYHSPGCSGSAEVLLSLFRSPNPVALHGDHISYRNCINTHCTGQCCWFLLWLSSCPRVTNTFTAGINGSHSFRCCTDSFTGLHPFFITNMTFGGDFSQVRQAFCLSVAIHTVLFVGIEHNTEGNWMVVRGEYRALCTLYASALVLTTVCVYRA